MRNVGSVRWDEMGDARMRIILYLRRGAELGRQLLAVPTPRGVELDQPEAKAGERVGEGRSSVSKAFTAEDARHEKARRNTNAPNTYFGELCTIEAPPFAVSSVTCSSSA